MKFSDLVPIISVTIVGVFTVFNTWYKFRLDLALTNPTKNQDKASKRRWMDRSVPFLAAAALLVMLASWTAFAVNGKPMTRVDVVLLVADAFLGTTLLGVLALRFVLSLQLKMSAHLLQTVKRVATLESGKIANADAPKA